MCMIKLEFRESDVSPGKTYQKWDITQDFADHLQIRTLPVFYNVLPL